MNPEQSNAIQNAMHVRWKVASNNSESGEPWIDYSLGASHVLENTFLASQTACIFEDRQTNSSTVVKLDLESFLHEQSPTRYATESRRVKRLGYNEEKVCVAKWEWQSQMGDWKSFSVEANNLLELDYLDGHNGTVISWTDGNTTSKVKVDFHTNKEFHCLRPLNRGADSHVVYAVRRCILKYEKMVLVLLPSQSGPLKVPGTIKYIGPHKRKLPGIRIGIKLEMPLGKNNGCVDGHYYFHCAPNHGILCTMDYVTEIAAETSNITQPQSSAERDNDLGWLLSNHPVVPTAPPAPPSTITDI
eukprot:m.154160 g.154160  ORF g.154160 m.154160 type:complete len:302 (-) comp15076_c0_seq6:2500-3405(-)